jgi:hypothetical protein
MPKSQVELAFPIRGINRTTRRDALPEATSWNLLNTLPFDVRGRARGGQRPGTTALTASALDGAVKGIITTLVPGSLGVVPVEGANFGDYANGSIFEVTAGLDTWITLYNSAAATNFSGTNESTTDAQRPKVTSGTAYNDSATLEHFDAYLNSALAANAPVDVTVVGYCSTTGTSSNTLLGFAVRVSTVTTAKPTTFLSVNFNRGAWSITTNGTGTVASGTYGPVADAEITARLTLTDNGLNTDYELLINGSSISTGSYLKATVPASNTGIGISLSNAVAQGTGAGGQKGIRSFSSGSPNDSAIFVTSKTAVAVADGSIHTGEELSSLTEASGIIATDGRLPSMTDLAGDIYIADGDGAPKKLVFSTNTVSTMSASAGTIPEDCRLTCTWRGRLVLASPAETPQNFFMSRVGDPTDWDYAETDPAAAFAGNASEAGRIGLPITALIPSSDDVLIIAGFNSLYAVRGDPADGGSIDTLSDAVGVVQQNAWCKGPDGTIYFVGFDGLYRMAPNGGQPENLSRDSYPQFFDSYVLDNNYLSLVYDQERHGVWIFVAPTDETAGNHLFWDARLGGLFPQRFPATHGPFAVSTPLTTQGVYLGGTDGHIRHLDTAEISDDGTAISSYVWIGPVKMAPGNTDGILTNLEFTLGDLGDDYDDGDFQIDYDVYAGRGAQEATREVVGSGKTSGRFTRSGRLGSRRARVRGAFMALYLSNSTLDKTWAFENVIAEFEQSGLTRR